MTHLEELQKLMKMFVEERVDQEFEDAFYNSKVLGDLYKWNTTHIVCEDTYLATTLTNLIRSGYRKKVEDYIREIQIEHYGGQNA